MDIVWPSGEYATADACIFWYCEPNDNKTIADIIIFLDFPFPLYVYRVLKRRFVNRGKTRDCMAAGCKEKFTLSFWVNLLRFRFLQRPYIFKLQRLATIANKPFFVLTKQQQVDELIKKVAQGPWEVIIQQSGYKQA